jgi:chromosome segregation ATPase
MTRPHAPTVLAELQTRLAEMEASLKELDTRIVTHKRLVEELVADAWDVRQKRFQLTEQIKRLQTGEPPANGQEGRNFSC